MGFTVAVFFFTGAPLASLAEGFPEQGNRADWSEAIPYYNLGNKYLEHQRYQDAVTSFEDAVAIYPYDADFHVNLGVAYRKLEDFTNAEKAFKRASTLNPKDWMVWSNLANAYLKQNKFKETKSAFERALTCNPPASEQTAIRKDLLDLQKIISMQETQAQAAQRKAKEIGTTAKKIGTTAKTAGRIANAQPKATTAVNTGSVSAKESVPLLNTPGKEQLRQGGWEY